MNQIGLDINAVGHREFDEGVDELIRLQHGGCHPTDGCLDGDGFAGADFQFLAANVMNVAAGEPLFPPYAIKTFNGAKVAFIGLTLEGTPLIVSPAGVAGLEFKDEADTVNALVPRLKQMGVSAIVVLVHEGGAQIGGIGINQCVGITGPIVDIVERLDPRVDLVISGHTHQPYNCVIDGIPVTSAFSFGRLVTDIDLRVDRAKKEVTSIAIENRIVTRTVPEDAGVSALIDRYNAIAAPIAGRVIGRIMADIPNVRNVPAGESAMGDVIADAQLDATKAPGFGDAVVAFMNPDGIRGSLTYASSFGEGDGNVTYLELFTVQPFGHNLVSMALTGAQIDALLEQQFDNPSTPLNRILQMSNGFSYTWSQSAPTGSKVDISSIKINDVTIDPSASYRVTVNSFLADGGDGFSVLLEGTNRLGGAVDVDALAAYFAARSPVAPGPQDRINVVP